MNLLERLKDRSSSKCELCSSTENLDTYSIPPSRSENLDENVLICKVCIDQIESPENPDTNHWRCLNDSMWSEHSAVKVVVWRMLSRLKHEGWPQDLLDMLYLEEDELKFAQATGKGLDDNDKIIHRDSNGVLLETGDSVVLIKDLKVKGSSMVAKQGTAVRRISLDRDNEKYIEGKVDGQHIVIITDYVKKM